MEHMRGQYGTLLTVAPNGQLWIADRYAQRLRHFTASGELAESLRIDSGEVTWAERSEEDYARLGKIGSPAGVCLRSREDSLPAGPVNLVAGAHSFPIDKKARAPRGAATKLLLCLVLVHPVERLREQVGGEGDEDEGDDGVDEQAEVHRDGAGFFGRREGGVGAGRRSLL